MPPNARRQEDSAGAWVPLGSPPVSERLGSATAEDWVVPESADQPPRDSGAAPDEVSWDVRSGAAGATTGGSSADELRRHRRAVAERLRQSSTWPRELEGRVRQLEARIDRVLDRSDGGSASSGSGRT
jgi:hypothetical protein